MSGALSFSRLTWRQLQMLTSSRGYRAMTLVVSLLLFVAALRGGRESAIAIAAYRTAVDDELAAWSENTPHEWLIAGVRKGRWAYLPPYSSQALAEGASKLQHTSCHARVGVAPAHRLDLTDGVLSWTPELRRLGCLDVSYVVLFLLPLWALMVSHDAVSGEKLRGTLRSALAAGVPRNWFLRAKWISGFIAIWVPTVIAILAGLLFATFCYGTPWNGGPRVAMYLAIVTAYLAFYLSLGLLASTCSSSPRTSLALVMMAWVFFSFVQPRINMLLVGVARPLPSSVSFEVKKRAALAEARRGYVEEHHSGATQNWMMERLLLAMNSTSREQSLQREFDEQVARSRALEDRLMQWSPFGLAYSAMVHVSGTGSSRYDRFRQACNDYRWQLTRHFADVVETARGETKDEHGLELDTSRAKLVLESAPSFVFHDIQSAELVAVVIGHVARLLGAALLLTFATSYLFSRYDAR